jgi:hypothetical protein
MTLLEKANKQKVMMRYRSTPPSLEQAKGMPIPMTNYSFGGGGEYLMSFSIKSFKSSIL